MSILSNATKSRSSGLVITLVGQPGTGKTSTACTFEKAFLIRTQGEDVPRDVATMPDSLGVTDTSQKLWDQMGALINDEHDYKTVIFDSVTGLEQLFIQEVLASDKKAKGINQALGGYGAGPAAVAAMHMRVRKGVEMMREKRGINIIFLAHADIQRIDPPDNESYSQYSLRLAGKSMAPYVDSVDVVGFLRLETFLMGDDDERKIAKTSGNIVLTTTLNPASISKNRVGIREDIVVEHGKNPLEQYL